MSRLSALAATHMRRIHYAPQAKVNYEYNRYKGCNVNIDNVIIDTRKRYKDI